MLEMIDRHCIPMLVAISVPFTPQVCRMIRRVTELELYINTLGQWYSHGAMKTVSNREEMGNGNERQ